MTKPLPRRVELIDVTLGRLTMRRCQLGLVLLPGTKTIAQKADQTVKLSMIPGRKALDRAIGTERVG